MLLQAQLNSFSHESMTPLNSILSQTDEIISKVSQAEDKVEDNQKLVIKNIKKGTLQIQNSA